MIKKSKKIIALALASCMIFSTLVGCGSNVVHNPTNVAIEKELSSPLAKVKARNASELAEEESKTNEGVSQDEDTKSSETKENASNEDKEEIDSSSSSTKRKKNETSDEEEESKTTSKKETSSITTKSSKTTKKTTTSSSKSTTTNALPKISNEMWVKWFETNWESWPSYWAYFIFVQYPTQVKQANDRIANPSLDIEKNLENYLFVQNLMTKWIQAYAPQWNLYMCYKALKDKNGIINSTPNNIWSSGSNGSSDSNNNSSSNNKNEETKPTPQPQTPIKTCNHKKISYIYETIDGTKHKVISKCNECSKQIFTKEEDCSFENGKCNKCGFGCIHLNANIYYLSHNDETHLKTISCTLCKQNIQNVEECNFNENNECKYCKYIKQQNSCNHESKIYKYINNNIHNLICTECNYNLTPNGEECSFENYLNKCDKCGNITKHQHQFDVSTGKCKLCATNDANSCDHENIIYKYTQNNQHDKYCNDCKSTLKTENCSHEIYKYKCDVCNNTLEHKHIYNINQSEEKTNICALCGYVCNHKNGNTQSFEDLPNKQHNIINICKNCSTTILITKVDCTYENGVCIYCGNVDENKCQHLKTYIQYVSLENDKHKTITYCDDCKKICEETISSCEFFDNVCKYCNYEKQTSIKCSHQNTTIYCESLNNGMHLLKKYCNSCNTYYEETQHECEYENNVCKYCNYVKESTQECKHSNTQTIYKSKGNGTHEAILYCQNCDTIFNNTIVDCDYENNVCKYCQYNNTNKECEHINSTSYYEYKNNNKHEVKKYCIDCCIYYYKEEENCNYEENKCKYCQHIKECEHESTSLHYDGQNTHDIICNQCNEIIKNEDCQYSTYSNKCDKCQGISLHNHNYENQICKNCGQKNNDICIHQDKIYKNNENGTHTIKCSNCGVTIANNEKCNYEENSYNCTFCNGIKEHLHIFEFKRDEQGNIDVNDEYYCKCKICKYQCPHETSITNITKTTASTHTIASICNMCGLTLNAKIESCVFDNGVCTICNNLEQTCEHTSTYSYYYLNNEQHEKYCQNCGDLVCIENCTHSTYEKKCDYCSGIIEHICNYNVGDEYEQRESTPLCILCGLTCSHNTTNGYYRYKQNNSHELFNACEDCKSILSTTIEPCSYNDSNNCEKCGNECSHEEKSQSGFQSIGNNIHNVYYTCNTCGKNDFDTTQAPCVDENNDEYCDLCENKICSHDNVSIKEINSNNNGTHSIVYKCNDCGYEETTNNVACSFEGNSNCQLCGYECDHNVEQVVYEYYEIQNNSKTHNKKTHCSRCLQNNKEIIEACDVSEETNKCKYCTCLHKEPSQIIYSYETNNDKTHKVVKKCSYCNVGIEIENNNESCSFENGKCNKCNYECLHNTKTYKNESKNNGTHEIKWKCVDCNYESSDGLEDCSFNNSICINCNYECTHDNKKDIYTSNGDNTHRKIISCQLCKKQLSIENEDCNFDSTSNCVYCKTTCTHNNVKIRTGVLDNNYQYIKHCYTCNVDIENITEPICDYGWTKENYYKKKLSQLSSSTYLNIYNKLETDIPDNNVPQTIELGEYGYSWNAAKGYNMVFSYNVSIDEYFAVFDTWLMDNPETTMDVSNVYAVRHKFQNGDFADITLFINAQKWAENNETKQKTIEDVQKWREEAWRNIEKDENDDKTLENITKYLANKIIYDENVYRGTSLAQERQSICQSIACVVNTDSRYTNRAVCASYSGWLYILAKDFNCSAPIYFTEGHAFNYAKKENGGWAYIDSTWFDDPYGRHDYNYFLYYPNKADEAHADARYQDTPIMKTIFALP